MSQVTKRALAASLKKLTIHKTLEKITIIDITEDCGVNRQTFYYHFQDIYDLVEWIFKSESLQVIDGNKTFDTWQNGFLHVFKYVLDNKTFVMRAYDSIYRDQLEQYLYNETYLLLMDVIKEKAKGINIRDKYIEFIADFYKYAFVGLLLNWIRNDMKESPEDIINCLGILIHNNIEKALNDFQ